MDAYKCYKLFKLKHLDGLKEEINSADLEFGTAIHFVIEHLIVPNDDVGTYSYEQLFESVWGSQYVKKDLTYGYLGYDTLYERGLELLRKFNKQHVKDFNPFRVEQRINFKILDDGAEFTGKPDFVGEYKGVPSIVDFKTSARAYPNMRKIMSDEQMAIYTIGVKKVWNYDVRQIVYKVLCKDESSRIQTQVLEIDLDWAYKMAYNANTVALDLSNRKDFPMNRYSCQNCNFFKTCYGSDK